MKPAVWVLAPRYPALSETFVSREVQGLESRGIEVRVLTLAPGESVEGVAPADAFVYGSKLRMLRAIGRELGNHPLTSARTVLLACADAIAPGEPTNLSGRAKVVVQSFAALSAAGELRRRGVGHLHCHFAHASTSVGMYLAQQLGVPFSFVGHANDLFQRRALLRRKLRRGAFVSCISEWHREFYCSTEPDSTQRYKVIRCGVDTDSWPYRPPRPADRLRVLSVCRLVEKKGMDTLLRALGQLRQQGHEVVEQVTIAGDGPELVRLRRLAQTEGVSNLVRWLGAVPNGRVRHLLQEADLFVLPCREDTSGDRDGIPVVFMEAMACGVPVISGDLPAIRELVVPGQTGLLVDGRCPEELSQAICAATDVTTRQRLASAARKHIEAEFSTFTNITRLVHALDEVTAA